MSVMSDPSRNATRTRRISDEPVITVREHVIAQATSDSESGALTITTQSHGVREQFEHTGLPASSMSTTGHSSTVLPLSVNASLTSSNIPAVPASHQQNYGLGGNVFQQQSRLVNNISSEMTPVDLPYEFHGDLNDQHLRMESHRLSTFEANWPSTAPVRPSELAAAGLYYLGIADIVKCPFCNGSLKQWEPGDIPLEEHRKFFPQCPFVLGHNVGNVPLQSQRARNESFPLEFRQDVFQVHNSPIYPLYSDYDTRLATFNNVSSMPEGQTAQDLARAGFYYIGPEDSVQCYWCGGSLKRWTRTDKPWSEHVRWFPHCGFLLSSGEPNSTATAASIFNNDVFATSSNVSQSETEIVPSPVPVLPVPVPAAGLISQQTITGGLTNLSIEDRTLNPDPKSSISSLPQNTPLNPTSSKPSPASADEPELEALQRENQRLKDSTLCKICMDREVNTLFLPCGHLVSCEECASSVQKCPICRHDIRGTIRTYIA